jgi:hypothetical protein
MRISAPEIDDFERHMGGPAKSACATCGKTLLMRCGGSGYVDYPDGSAGRCVNLPDDQQWWND